MPVPDPAVLDREKWRLESEKSRWWRFDAWLYGEGPDDRQKRRRRLQAASSGDPEAIAALNDVEARFLAFRAMDRRNG